MPIRFNFPSYKKRRREAALYRLQEQLKTPDKEFRNTTKKFRKCPPSAENKKELDIHRKWIEEQISILKEKLKGSI